MKRRGVHPNQSALFADPVVSNRLSRRDAERRMEDGMRRSRKHAEARLASWRLVAMIALEKFVRERGMQPFLAEAFVDWCRETRVPQPPDGRAWGSVISGARRLGTIERIGTAPAATSNLSPKPLWRAVEMELPGDLARERPAGEVSQHGTV